MIQKRRESVALRGGIVIHPSAAWSPRRKANRAFALDVDDRRGQIENTAFVRKARKVLKAGKNSAVATWQPKLRWRRLQTDPIAAPRELHSIRERASRSCDTRVALPFALAGALRDPRADRARQRSSQCACGLARGRVQLP